MAFLFAVVLTFARLSADGELPALLAAGYSLKRAAKPVFLTAALLYGVGAICAINLEAWGRREFVQFFYRKTQTELDNMIRYRMQAGVFLDNFLGYVLYAEGISADRSTFKNVLLAPGHRTRNQNFTLLAPQGQIVGSVESGDLRMTFEDGVAYTGNARSDTTTVMKFGEAEIDILKIFQEQILGADRASDDFRSYPPDRLWAYIAKLGDMPIRDKRTESTYRRARFLFHYRLASPFAVVAFAFYGMVLGVADPRRGRSLAYGGAIVTIISGYVLTMGFRWAAEQGHLSAPLAAWSPNVIMIAFGAFLLFQKNRLPPSEGTLELSNLPLLQRQRKI